MILVTGATGTYGSEVVKQLTQKDVPVRVLIHQRQLDPALKGPQVQEVVGDFDDPETLVAAIEGVEAIFLLSPEHPLLPQRERNVIEAAKRAGVKHIVRHSTTSSAADSVVELGRWHWQAEQALLQSGIPYTLVQPFPFMQTLLPMIAGTVAQFGTLALPFQDACTSYIDMRDAAAIVTHTLTEAGHEGKTYTITGSQALSSTNLAEQLTAILHFPISNIPMPLPAWQQGLQAHGVPPVVIAHLTESVQYILAGNTQIVTEHVTKITGTSPRTFEQFVQEHLLAFKGPGTQTPPRPRPHHTVPAGMIKYVGHVAIYVSDIERSRAFYEDILGMHFSEIVYPSDSPLSIALGITFCFMSFGTDHHDIVLVKQTDPTGQIVPVDSHEFHHLALELQPGMTTQQFAERLKQRDIPIFYGPVLHRKGPYGDGGSGGNLAVYFSDPDGHQIEVFSGMDPF